MVLAPRTARRGSRSSASSASGSTSSCSTSRCPGSPARRPSGGSARSTPRCASSCPRATTTTRRGGASGRRSRRLHPEALPPGAADGRDRALPCPGRGLSAGRRSLRPRAAPPRRPAARAGSTRARAGLLHRPRSRRPPAAPRSARCPARPRKSAFTRPTAWRSPSTSKRCSNHHHFSSHAHDARRELEALEGIERPPEAERLRAHDREPAPSERRLQHPGAQAVVPATEVHGQQVAAVVHVQVDVEVVRPHAQRDPALVEQALPGPEGPGRQRVPEAQQHAPILFRSGSRRQRPRRSRRRRAVLGSADAQTDCDAAAPSLLPAAGAPRAPGRGQAHARARRRPGDRRLRGAADPRRRRADRRRADRRRRPARRGDGARRARPSSTPRA